MIMGRKNVPRFSEYATNVTILEEILSRCSQWGRYVELYVSFARSKMESTVTTKPEDSVQ